MYKEFSRISSFDQVGVDQLLLILYYNAYGNRTSQMQMENRMDRVLNASVA